MIAHVRVVALFVLLLSIIGCAGGTDPKPDWATAPDVDLSAYSTFGWADAPADPPRALLDTEIRNAIRTALVDRGYVESATAPDLIVSYETVEYETPPRSNPVSIGIGVGSWGGNVGGSVGTSVGVGGDDDPRLQSRVTIHAVDPESNREVWIGTTTTFQPPADAGVVDRVVSGVMKGFPERGN